MQVKTIVDAVAGELGDASKITWTRSDLIGLLNQAVKQTILVRPDAGAVTENFALESGTKQDLPSTALRLLDAPIRNMGADGNTPGKALKFIDSDTLDAFDPDWHSNPSAAVIENYLYTESNPGVFYVNPPSDGSTQIEVSVSKLPIELDPAMIDATYNDVATVVGMKDIYENVLMEWMKYKAFSFERASATSQAAAGMHMQSFYNALGVKLNADAMNSPTNDNGST